LENLLLNGNGDIDLCASGMNAMNCCCATITSIGTPTDPIPEQHAGDRRLVMWATLNPTEAATALRCHMLDAL
jgi:hypothetical protein